MDILHLDCQSNLCMVEEERKALLVMTQDIGSYRTARVPTCQQAAKKADSRIESTLNDNSFTLAAKLLRQLKRGMCNHEIMAIE